MKMNTYLTKLFTEEDIKKIELSIGPIFCISVNEDYASRYTFINNFIDKILYNECTDYGVNAQGKDLRDQLLIALKAYKAMYCMD